MTMTDMLWRSLRISVSLAIFVLAVSCTDFIVGLNIRKMLGREIVFPSKCSDIADSGRPKMVFHYQPSDCSTCRIRSIGNYEGLIARFDEAVDFVFLFSTTDIGYNRVKSEIEGCTLNHHVYIDKGDEFDQLNVFLPENPKYRVFLLDRNNRVVYVGDPILGGSLLRLFEKRIAEVK